MPTKEELTEFVQKSYKGVDLDAIFTYLQGDEYSYRRMKHCIFLQQQYPGTWESILEQRVEERVAAANPKGDLLLEYQDKAMNPEIFVQGVLEKKPELLEPYGECLELAGSTWAFLSYAL